MGDFTVNVKQKPMDFNRGQLGLIYLNTRLSSDSLESVFERHCSSSASAFFSLALVGAQARYALNLASENAREVVAGSVFEPNFSIALR